MIVTVLCLCVVVSAVQTFTLNVDTLTPEEKKSLASLYVGDALQSGQSKEYIIAAYHNLIRIINEFKDKEIPHSPRAGDAFTAEDFFYKNKLIFEEALKDPRLQGADQEKLKELEEKLAKETAETLKNMKMELV